MQRKQQKVDTQAQEITPNDSEIYPSVQFCEDSVNKPHINVKELHPACTEALEITPCGSENYSYVQFCEDNENQPHTCTNVDIEDLQFDAEMLTDTASLEDDNDYKDKDPDWTFTPEELDDADDNILKESGSGSRNDIK